MFNTISALGIPLLTEHISSWFRPSNNSIVFDFVLLAILIFDGGTETKIITLWVYAFMISIDLWTNHIRMYLGEFKGI